MRLHSMATPSSAHPAGVGPADPDAALPQRATDLSKSWEEFFAFPQDDELTEVQRTARVVAGMRAVDQMSTKPLFRDPLVEFLAGSQGLARARATLERNNAGRAVPPDDHDHNGVAARCFVVDDAVLRAVKDLRASSSQRIQVVSLGAGMDTRPWRLPDLGRDVAWWEVDMHDMITLKTRLLVEAGAEVGQQAAMGGGAGLQDQAAVEQSALPRAQATFPLKCGALTMVPCTLAAAPDEATAGLKQAMMATGFDPALPTVWVAEGLVMYLDLPTLSDLLADMADLSVTGSVAIITSMSKEALDEMQASITAARTVSQAQMDKFWMYNSIEDLIGLGPGVPGLLQGLGWSVSQLVPDLRDLVPVLAPGHCSSAYGFLSGKGSVAGLVVATRDQHHQILLGWLAGRGGQH